MASSVGTDHGFVPPDVILIAVSVLHRGGEVDIADRAIPVCREASMETQLGDPVKPLVASICFGGPGNDFIQELCAFDRDIGFPIRAFARALSVMVVLSRRGRASRGSSSGPIRQIPDALHQTPRVHRRLDPQKDVPLPSR